MNGTRKGKIRMLSFEAELSKGTEPSERKRKRRYTEDLKQKRNWKVLNIHLLNVQGLTRAKQVEIEELIKEKGSIICLTETQQKYDKITWTDSFGKVEKMRDVSDKKGGGLLILFKLNDWFKLEQIETKNADVLYATIKASGSVLHIILVYLSIPKTSDDRERNRSEGAHV